MSETLDLNSLKRIPNLLSIARIVMTVPICLLIKYETADDTFLLALVVFAILTDFLDGYLARRMGQETVLGRILDPIADKFALVAGLAALAVWRHFPVSLLLLLAYRDVLIVVLGTIAAKRTRTVVAANLWGKLNTAAISLLVLLFILRIESQFVALLLFSCYITTAVSGVLYLRLGLRLLFESLWSKLVLITGILIGLLLVLSIELPSGSQAQQRPIAVTTSHPGMLEQLARYAPVLYFDEDESFYPIAVESILDHSRFVESSVFLPFDRELTGDQTIEQLMTNFNDSAHYLKIDRSLFDDIGARYTGCKNDYPVTVYARSIRVDEDSRTSYILQYWLFFWASTAGSLDVIWHECDWEVVMYWVDSTFAPVRAGYSQHHYGATRNWSEIELDDGRPVAYVSRGGHSMHFEEGKHTAYIDSHGAFPLGYDLCSSGVRVAPDSYALLEISDSLAWVDWKGFWGLPVTYNLPGPKYRHPNDPGLTMWSNPVSWFRQYETSPLRLSDEDTL